MVNVLAIDYGNRFMGVAVSIDSKIFPLESIDLKKSLAIDVIKNLVSSYHIDKIVLGLPTGNPEQEERVKRFMREIEESIKIKCRFIDESMTSKISEEKLKELGFGRKVVKTKSHSIAASILLRSYLQLSSSEPYVEECIN